MYYHILYYVPSMYDVCSSMYCLPLRLVHKQLQQLGVVGSSQPSHRVPALNGLERRHVAARVAALGDIVEHIGVLVQHGVHKPDRALASRQTFLVDTGQDGGEDRRRGRCTTDQVGDTGAEHEDIVRHGSHVRVRTANTVVDTAVLAQAAVVHALVVLVAGVVLGEVVLDNLALVIRPLVDVAETTARRELDHRLLFVLLGVRTGREVGSARGSQVGACRRELRCEDVVVLSKAVAWSRVAAAAGHTGVTRGHHDGNTLHTQLHELVALAALVRNGHVGFGTTVRDGNHVGWLVHSTLQLTLVTAIHIVRVRWVDVRVTGDTVRRVRAVRSIDGVEEVVKESRVVVVLLVLGVVGLVQDRVLRPDNGVRDLEVQVGFRSGLQKAVGRCLSSINGIKDGVSASGNFTAVG